MYYTHNHFLQLKNTLIHLKIVVQNMGTQFGGETMKELPALPKLPHGEGSFSYHHKKGITSIRLRKRINGKPEDAYGSSTKECLKKMKEKERSILEKAKYYHPTDGLGVVLLQDAMVHWLETYKNSGFYCLDVIMCCISIC